MRKTTAALAILSMCLSTFPAAAAADPGVTDSEIHLGSCAPLTGGNKINGIAYTNGAKVYFDYLNAEKGGIHGRKVKLAVEDDGYEPEKAVVCYRKLVDSGVFATGLAVGTPTGVKYVALAENNKVPFVGNSGGGQFMHEPMKKYVFAVRASYADEVRFGVEHLWNDVGARKFAVIYQNDALGGSVLDGVRSALKPFGGEVVAQASYPRNTTDVEGAIKTVKAANPDVVYIGGVTVPEAEILKKSKEAGWKPIFVPVPARDAELVKTAGEAADGIVVGNATPNETQAQLPTVALFKKSMKKYMPEADAGAMSLLGFVDAMMIGEGLKRGGKDLSRDKFIAGLESMSDFDAGLGPDFKVSYSATDHKAFDKVFFSTIHGGKTVAIADWKKEFGGK